jgi:hypothetical protein
MVSRRRRALVATGVALVVIVLAAVVVLPAMVPREKLRAMAEETLRQRTGGDVSLGELSLDVLPRLRLVLDRSHVAVTGEGLAGAGLQAGPLVSGRVDLARLDIDVALWPLLQRRVEVGQIRLVEPRLDVVTAPADGAGGPADGGGGGGAAVGLALAAVSVQDGALAWREAGTGRGVRVTGWQQQMQAPDLDVLLIRLQRMAGQEAPVDHHTGAATLHLEARIDSLVVVGVGDQPTPPLTDLSLVASVSAPQSADRLDVAVIGLEAPPVRAAADLRVDPRRVIVDRLELAVGDAVNVTGTASLPVAAGGGAMQADLAGSLRLALLLDTLAPYLPAPEVDAPPLPGLDGDLALAVRADLPQAPSISDAEAWGAARARGLDGTLQVTARGGPVTVTAPALGAPLRLGAVDLAADLRSPSSPARLRLTGIDHPGITGDAQLTVRPAGDDGVVRADLALPRLDLDALAEQARRMQACAPPRPDRWTLVTPAWAAAEQSTIRPGDLIPPELAVDLTAEAAELVFLKTPYTDISLRGRLRDRVIDATDLGARLGTGSVRGTARLDYASDPGGRAAWDVRVQDAPATALMKPYLGDLAAVWTGSVSASARGACDLADPDAMKRSLTVVGNLAGSDGVIDLREQLAEIRPYLGDRDDLLRVRYSAARQGYEVRDAKVMVQGLHIDGHDTDWTGGGWIGLDGDLVLDLSVKLPRGFTPDLGDLSFAAEALRGDDGRIGLDLAVTGRTDRPRVTLKVDREKLQDQLLKEAKKGLGGFLDRLKGK